VQLVYVIKIHQHYWRTDRRTNDILMAIPR